MAGQRGKDSDAVKLAGGLVIGQEADIQRDGLFHGVCRD
jgi:hypothetical protein